MLLIRKTSEPVVQMMLRWLRTSDSMLLLRREARAARTLLIGISFYAVFLQKETTFQGTTLEKSGRALSTVLAGQDDNETVFRISNFYGLNEYVLGRSQSDASLSNSSFSFIPERGPHGTTNLMERIVSFLVRG
eukprot:TRINITY_DN50410_c0_g1_i1.p1 TRINITY_DN50410_c0_g1~~TRINITY_DN50410_c0_g1_i1.p1  ORF type:complete len:134 (+),score=12.01 TRINITY_DN50410_c0_g1_i1:23-424(+)